MKYLSKTIFIIFILCFSLGAAPVIQLNKHNLTFSLVKQGTILKDRSVIIKNTGDQNLNLQFQTTCDCITVKTDKNLLKPGESLQLQITLKTSAYNYDFKKTFYIMSNDPQHKIIAFLIKVQINKSSK